jgi:hypothetical protein
MGLTPKFFNLDSRPQLPTSSLIISYMLLCHREGSHLLFLEHVCTRLPPYLCVHIPSLNTSHHQLLVLPEYGDTGRQTQGNSTPSSLATCAGVTLD